MIRTLPAHDGAVGDLRFTDRGQRLTSVGGFDGTVRVWDMPSGRTVGRPVLLPDALVGPMALAPGANFAVAPAVGGAGHANGGRPQRRDTARHRNDERVTSSTQGPSWQPSGTQTGASASTTWQPAG